MLPCHRIIKTFAIEQVSVLGGVDVPGTEKDFESSCNQNRTKLDGQEVAGEAEIELVRNQAVAVRWGTRTKVWGKPHDGI